MKKQISLLLAVLLVCSMTACAAEEAVIEKPERSVYKADVQEYLEASVDEAAELSGLHVEDTEVDDDQLIVLCSVDYETADGECSGIAELTYACDRGDWTLEECRLEQNPGEEGEAAEEPADTATEAETEAETIPEIADVPVDPCEVEGHLWAEATYSAPRTCTVCGITDGQTLGYPLAWCEIVESTNASRNKDVVPGEWKDTYGTTHPDSVRFWVKEVSGYNDTEYGVFDLGGTYRTMTATMAAEEANSGGCFTKFMVYADDVLIYESEDIYSGTQPFSVTLDVEGVQLLRVLCTTDSAEDSYGLFDALLYQ